MRGLVLRAHTGFIYVQTDHGVLECRLRGRLKQVQRRTDLVVAGDEVEVDAEEGTVERILPRRTKLSRRAPERRGRFREDVIVANADQVLVVFACARPEPNPRLIDRFLVVAEQNEVEAVVVANKVDLVGEEAARAVFGVYERIGYAVHYVSAKQDVGFDALRGRLYERVSVVSGPSGAGKSTLLNALVPGLALATDEISEASETGRHTTILAELHPVPGGGYVVDTPGLRELGLWEIEADELPWLFREFRPYVTECHFDDCRHLVEPGCAVRAAVESGEIAASRYESFRALVQDEERG